MASNAAKEAVSVRLRLRSERAKETRSSSKTARTSEPDKPIAHRIFEDVRGTRWHAFAVERSSESAGHSELPDEFRHGWLVFESSDELRRLAPIPQRWEELSTDELRLLCHQAAAVPRRTGGDPIEDSPNPDPPIES